MKEGSSESLSPEQLSADSWDLRYLEDKTGWDRGGVNPQLNTWLAQGHFLDGPVLIPGCGRGHEALLLARKGYEVTAVDFAPSAIKYLKHSLALEDLSAEVHCADILETSFEGEFSSVYEQTYLCALHPSLRATYVGKLREFLAVGGRLYAMFMQSNVRGKPPYNCSIKDMRELFSEDVWRWPEHVGKPVPLNKTLFELPVILERRS